MQRYVLWNIVKKTNPRKGQENRTKIRTKKGKNSNRKKNFHHIIQFISADTSVCFIDEINVEALSSLSANKIEWLTKMVNQGSSDKKAVVTIKDYVKGFMEGTDKPIDEERDDEIVEIIVEDDNVR